MLDIDQRLIMDFHFTTLDCSTQFVFQSAPVTDDVTKFIGVERISAATSRLGIIERNVGYLEKLVEIPAIGRTLGDTNTCANIDLVAVDQDRIGDFCNQSLGKLLAVLAP